MFIIPTTFSALVNWAQRCKQDIATCFSIISSPDQEKRLKALFKATKEHTFFECEGELFKGNRKLVFIQFILDEPTGADFYVWCRKNLIRYTAAH